MMPGTDEFDDADGQDLAEVFDEENITEDGRDIATSDMQRDVYDVTAAPEDATDALAPEDDFDPDALDEAEREQVLFADEDLDEPRSFAADDAARVANDDLQPEDLEPGRTAAADYDAEDAMADAIDRERQPELGLDQDDDEAAGRDRRS
jgi:hypothetical protein